MDRVPQRNREKDLATSQRNAALPLLHVPGPSTHWASWTQPTQPVQFMAYGGSTQVPTDEWCRLPDACHGRLLTICDCHGTPDSKVACEDLQILQTHAAQSNSRFLGLYVFGAGTAGTAGTVMWKFPRTWTPVPKTEIEWLKPNSLKVIRASRPSACFTYWNLGVFGICADYDDLCVEMWICSRQNLGVKLCISFAHRFSSSELSLLRSFTSWVVQ